MPTRLRLIAVLSLVCGLAACFPAGGPAPLAGSIAPPFRLADQTGAWHALSDYRGKWVVLYFYPKDNTPGCTTQACEFRDNLFAFDQLNAVILGISVDDVTSHKQFAEAHHLPFTLLADAGKDTARQYGVLRSALGVMQIASRDTFLIDPNGTVVRHYAHVDPKGHSQQVLADLRVLQKRS
jgi:peroxiredoxin Q/BCP